MNNVIDKLLLEWSWRCEKGYPDINNPADKKVLDKLLKEYNILLENTPTTAPQKNIQNPFSQKVSEVGKKLSKEILQIYNTLSPQVQAQVNQEVEKHTISSFKNNISRLSTIFAPFFNISNEGAGRGELLPLFTIKGSKSGGTADKDVLVGSDVIEVKELDKGNKFRTGKTGSIRDSKLDENTQTFIKILRNLPVQEIQKQKEDILLYYSSTYKYGSGKPSFFLKDIKDLLVQLKNLDLKSYLKGDGEEYVKIDGVKRFFTQIDGETLKLGKSVDVGQESIVKLVKHPYYEDPDNIKKDLEDLKLSYLDTVSYLLLYPKGNPTSPIFLTKDEAKTKVETYDINQQSVRLRYITGDSKNIEDEDLNEEEDF
jgi:hypothetical protein